MKIHTSTMITGVILASLILARPAGAHCEIPCGIYGDRMRVAMIEEHCQTIEKSMLKVVELQDGEKQDANQLVRWVTNKEHHAEEIQHVISQYFLHQRIKPVKQDAGEAYETYVSQLTLLHRMLISAMKCKQTTDVKHVTTLRSLLHDFEHAYFAQDEKE